jgi:hypothetical protein
MNRWLNEFIEKPTSSHHQNPQKPISEVLGVGDRGISQNYVLDSVDIADHFHERAGTLEFDGECPRDLADHMALLETMHWWLQIQHPEVIAQWMQLAGTIPPPAYSQNPQNHQK